MSNQSAERRPAFILLPKREDEVVYVTKKTADTVYEQMGDPSFVTNAARRMEEINPQGLDSTIHRSLSYVRSGTEAAAGLYFSGLLFTHEHLRIEGEEQVVDVPRVTQEDFDVANERIKAYFQKRKIPSYSDITEEDFFELEKIMEERRANISKSSPHLSNNMLRIEHALRIGGFSEPATSIFASGCMEMFEAASVSAKNPSLEKPSTEKFEESQTSNPLKMINNTDIRTVMIELIQDQANFTSKTFTELIGMGNETMLQSIMERSGFVGAVLGYPHSFEDFSLFSAASVAMILEAHKRRGIQLPVVRRFALKRAEDQITPRDPTKIRPETLMPTLKELYSKHLGKIGTENELLESWFWKLLVFKPEDYTSPDVINPMQSYIYPLLAFDINSKPRFANT